jgi:hypothetical protein
MGVWNPQWYVYINGYRFVQTRSIGYKWVYYKAYADARYSRMSRKAWDKCLISTGDEQQHRNKVFNQAKKLGVAMYARKRSNSKVRPRSFAEIEAEVIERGGNSPTST